MVRKLFLISASMLMLAIAFHLGYSTATAQAPGNPVVAALNDITVVTANGDVYNAPNGINSVWVLTSNVFSGPPTPVLRESWGQLKSRYAPTPGTARPGAEGR